MNNTKYVRYVNRSNRNTRKRWFITFPQWEEKAKTELLEETLSILPPGEEVKEYVVARETHSDGGTHYHMIIVLERGINKRYLLNKYEEIYPNDYKRVDVGTVKNLRAAIEYLQKEDPEPLQHTHEEQREWERREREAQRFMIGSEEREFFTRIMLSDLLDHKFTCPASHLKDVGRDIGTNGTWQSLKEILFRKWKDAQR